MTEHPRPDHNEFALRLHAALVGAGGSTVVWSPYSVAAVLGLLASGARGRTRTALTGLLGADLDGHLAALDHAVDGCAELVHTTALWHSAAAPVVPGFAAGLRARGGAELRTVDFAADPEGARGAINSEVARATGGLVDELLAPGTITAGTLAVPVSALGARARWRDPFDPARTAPRPFTGARGTRQVPMMRTDAWIPHAAADGWRMVTLDGQDDVRLDVLLPDPDTRAPAPSAAVWAALHRAATVSAQVALELPRFRLDTGGDLAPAVTAAGGGALFAADADLSGLSPTPLRIDTVAHRAVLHADEAGAVGAAATAAVAYSGMSVPTRIRFTVDRTFTVVLRRRGVILFLGLVTDPGDTFTS